MPYKISGPTCSHNARKKSTVFSTNANSTTKDNISNVYGAKTITALIPLNLEFEMDPSNQPGATQSASNWSTHDQSGSRTVKIVGHISRPVVGEGRQTPDRQMFFVNSRPCNLPQVAKAFNEVYKSFNITQSPFVFADIKLDTNAYDVNVSPDKRTIMLHDQTTLLENLKNALLELFEGQNQTMPQSQLLGKTAATSAFRPPTMQQRYSTQSVRVGNHSELESTNEVLETPSDRDKVLVPPDMPEVLPSPGFIKASLIERFAGRDAEDRLKHTPTRKRMNRSPEVELAPDISTATIDRQQHDVSSEQNEQNEGPRDQSQSPLFEPEQISSNVPTRPSQPSKIVQDFNARIHGRASISLDRNATADVEDLPVSSVTQTSRRTLSQGSIHNAFDRMRPARTPVQQTIITVGGATILSTIGTGSQTSAAKRARIHTPKFSLSGKPLNQTPNKTLFRRGLSNFTAPGTQVDSSEDDEGTQYYNTPVVSVRSPSPRKRLPSETSKEPQTDDMMTSSSAPSSPPGTVHDETLHISRHTDTDPNIVAEVIEPDDEYIEETEKRAREEAKIAKMIADAEEATARPTDLNLKRASKLFKITQKKYWTINLERIIEIDIKSITQQLHSIRDSIEGSAVDYNNAVTIPTSVQLNQEDPEERLTLTVTKPDFHAMKIIGQFNLGFIIAIRPPTPTSTTSDLFIIDQHASDEKYNFERLSATTTLVSQRLVHPHPLELTAVEQELILANEHSLTANGFVVDLNSGDDDQPTHRANLTALPMSREVTFTPNDLEELLALILDNPPPSSNSPLAHIPRPSKVRKLLASRACRSSVMIGKTLQHARMKEIVRHMGSMDKPWSCPHGRPTMRHLYGLESWRGWREGDGVTGVDVLGGKTTWARYLSDVSS